MAKKNKKEEIKEVVVTEETTEVVAEETPKKKTNLKKIVGIAAGSVAAVGAVVGAVLVHNKKEKEILEYMESCGDKGTDIPDDEKSSDEVPAEETEYD